MSNRLGAASAASCGAGAGAASAASGILCLTVDALGALDVLLLVVLLAAVGIDGAILEFGNPDIVHCPLCLDAMLHLHVYNLILLFKGFVSGTTIGAGGCLASVLCLVFNSDRYMSIIAHLLHIPVMSGSCGGSGDGIP